jgi:iron(III) transport system ATP-binding protein
MVAGFNSIEGGTISFDSQVINDIAPAKRNIGMVFQNYAVFPHMTVRQNVEFGLKNRKLPKDEINARVNEILETVKITEYASRLPERLSGGQQQRVALARAIVIEPEVLLMDEPLSNLDAKLRVEMRNVIKRIQHQIGITTVYVTHDQEEALAISDRIAVMNGGVIQQVGTPKHIYQRPANEFVSTFIGLSNLLDADCKDNTLDFGGNYRVPVNTLKDGVSGKVHVAVRPEEFTIHTDGAPGIPATVTSSVFLGMTQHYFMQLQNGREIEVVENSDLTDIIPDGSKVTLQIMPHKVNIFDAETRATLIREGA